MSDDVQSNCSEMSQMLPFIQVFFVLSICLQSRPPKRCQMYIFSSHMETSVIFVMLLSIQQVSLFLYASLRARLSCWIILKRNQMPVLQFDVNSRSLNKLIFGKLRKKSSHFLHNMKHFVIVKDCIDAYASTIFTRYVVILHCGFLNVVFRVFRHTVSFAPQVLKHV